MPNFKVHVNLRDCGSGPFTYHAMEVYIDAPSILAAGNDVVASLTPSFTIGASDIDRISEIPSEIPSKPRLNDVCEICDMQYGTIPTLRFTCRNRHIEIRDFWK